MRNLINIAITILFCAGITVISLFVTNANLAKISSLEDSFALLILFITLGILPIYLAISLLTIKEDTDESND